MIYDRHEDIAATTKRHPAIVRHRTGVTRDGRLIAQDIEVVMDGGAYCTLTPVVLSRGAIHAGGPYRCPNVRIRARATRTNTPPNGAFRGFGAPQVQFAAETHLNRIAETLGDQPARDPAAERLPGSATRRRPARSCATAWPARRSSSAPPRRPSSSGCATRRDAARRQPRGLRPDARLAVAERVANGWPRGIGLALAWHGAGFTGSGEVKLASVASLELTAERRDPHPDRLDRDGPGDQDDLPAARRRGAGRPDRGGRARAAGHRLRARFGPDRRVADGDGRRRPADQGRRSGCASEVEAATGGSFAATYRDVRGRANGALRIDQRFEPYPGVGFDDVTYRGDAYPAFGWAACVARVEVDLDTGEVQVRDVVAADDIGRVIHPVLAEGQVEGGTLQAVGYATIEEIKLRDGRYLNDRLATYIIPTALDAPRITTILVEAPFAGVPHGAKGVGELPMDVGAPAVVAAIADATGVWIGELPASPERILAALSGVPGVAPLPPGASEPAA